jgi:hypothetical protein
LKVLKEKGIKMPQSKPRLFGLKGHGGIERNLEIKFCG